jgi:hypothetical protein
LANDRLHAIAECREIARRHGLTACEVFPPETTGIDMLDLDAVKAAGLNSRSESERLLAAHRKQEGLR